MENLKKSKDALPEDDPANPSALDGQEPYRRFVEWNQARREYPYEKCVHQLFEEQAGRTPEAVAVVFEGQRLTYRELNQQANQLARHLQARGVGPDVPVGVCLERSLELLVAILGILKAGGAYVPLDPDYPPERITFMLEKTRARVLIESGTHINKFNPTPEVEVVQLGADWPVIAGHSSANLSAIATARNLIYVIFTSGSTGQPKGAAVYHGGFSNLLQWFVTDFAINDADHTLLVSSISFDLTQKNLYAPLLCGGTLFLSPPGPYDAALIARLISDHGITLINCTPSAFYPLVERGDERDFESLATLRLVFLGGEIISIPRIRSWFGHHSCHAEIVNTYGPTECTDICGSYRLTRENLDRYDFVPLGKPISNVQLVIVDDALQPCLPGTPGELCIGGTGVGAGYINDPEMTTAKFLPNPFPAVSGEYIYRTGDRVRLLPDGNLEFLGRQDHQLKIRGFRIELGEIESALHAHPNIHSAAVTARVGAAGETFLAAHLVARHQPAPAVSELREFLKTRLPDYMVPTAFVTLESLPLNANGKVDRQALPAPGESCRRAEVDFTPPTTPTEMALAKIWQELLGVGQIGVHDNFFALGGHSLIAVRLVNEIRRHRQFELPMRVLFQHPTIHELANVLQNKKTRERMPELIQIRAGHSGPALFFLTDEGNLGLFKLAPYLDKNQPLYATLVPFPEAALAAAAKNQLAAVPRMEAWAAEHVALIRSRQPAGPVLLAGHCFGGMLAFEVARQLQAAGIPVRAVLLLDAWMANPSFWWQKKAWLREHVGNLLRRGPGYLWQKISRRRALKKEGATPPPELAVHPDSSLPVSYATIDRIQLQVMNCYRPERLACRGVAFLSQDDWLSNAYRPLDNTLGAGPLFAGGVEVVNVPGNHVTVLNEEHLPELGARFNKCLEQFR
jgi:amino acid adenylation domain-containing protein